MPGDGSCGFRTIVRLSSNSETLGSDVEDDAIEELRVGVNTVFCFGTNDGKSLESPAKRHPLVEQFGRGQSDRLLAASSIEDYGCAFVNDDEWLEDTSAAAAATFCQTPILMVRPVNASLDSVQRTIFLPQPVERRLTARTVTFPVAQPGKPPQAFLAGVHFAPSPLKPSFGAVGSAMARATPRPVATEEGVLYLVHGIFTA